MLASIIKMNLVTLHRTGIYMEKYFLMKLTEEDYPYAEPSIHMGMQGVAW